MVSVTKEQLKAMTEEELVYFAWSQLGIALDASWGKTKLLGKILGMAASFT